MTDSNARREYNAQGQQDDYFDEDLTIAGHSSPTPVAIDENNQGQQDDYFDEDLAQSDRPTQSKS